MKIDKELLDKLSEQAKASPRLRMNLDLRNSAEDKSQRMLNALEPGTVVPVHRHRFSSETVVCFRGHLRELFYDENGEKVVEVVDLMAGGDCCALNIPLGIACVIKVVLVIRDLSREKKEKGENPRWRRWE